MSTNLRTTLQAEEVFRQSSNTGTLVEKEVINQLIARGMEDADKGDSKFGNTQPLPIQRYEATTDSTKAVSSLAAILRRKSE